MAITAPQDNATESGVVPVSASAGDNVGVSGVQFLVDGAASGAEDTSSPYALSWDSRSVGNGAHTLRARARDAAGNATTSGPVTVNVANTDSFQNEILATGFDLPTTFEFLPDGRMLVAELQGKIKVLPPPYTQPEAALFLQITNIGSAGVQQGIYDIALDPAFAFNHFYYVFYTTGQLTLNHDRVSRFTANATLTGTVPGSEFVLYEDDQGADPEHHGGSLAFDNGGKLLFTTGDHFKATESVPLTSPRGKVHRINTDGTGPTHNPFYDGAGPNIDRIWARGLRNPFRAYYDAPTGRYYIADVGGNDSSTAKEEINLGARGADSGWPNSEGPCSAPCTSPLYFYSHNGRDASVTGGFVYRGSQFPSSYRGAYFYADYAQNWIKGLRFDANGAVTGTFNFEPPDGTADGPYGDIVYLDEGPDGALYYVDLGYSDVTGTSGVSKIRRIKYVQSNQAPVVAASATPTSGRTPLNVAFSSSGSSDPEGQALTYSWTFGDGATSTAANPSHTYATAGAYQARLTVSDGVNSSLSTPITISAGSVPTATILSPTDGTQFQAGDVIAYSGDGSDPDDGRLPDSAFTWNIDFLHDGHVHPGITTTGVRSGTFTIPTSGHDFSGNTRYRITLTVRDSSGLSSTRSVTMQPRKVNLSFDTLPAGRTLYLDGIAKVAPFTYDTLVGFNHNIEARTQTAGSTFYTFASWSDGGAQQHTIAVPPTPQSYVATFNSAPLPTGLVGAWGLNEGAGTAVSDSSGNGNHGTLVGTGATWDASGKYGSALSFNGSSGIVTVPQASSLSMASSYTVEAWVKP
ncbi:MAG: PQQ-dependent sugar dehydrogenase, partial [Betaproteobacteria bacterium]